ncbi:MAG TPA: hypothetical protein VFF03_04285, partial [Rhodocyclaceae bacterium]|nr:hypothetical protein [Rhodocyclaceae bacterium]
MPTGRNAGRASEPHPARENPAPLAEPSPRVEAGALLEAARHQIREESRQRSSSIFATAPPAAEEYRSNPITRAMAR